MLKWIPHIKGGHNILIDEDSNKTNNYTPIQRFIGYMCGSRDIDCEDICDYNIYENYLVNKLNNWYVLKSYISKNNYRSRFNMTQWEKNTKQIHRKIITNRIYLNLIWVDYKAIEKMPKEINDHNWSIEHWFQCYVDYINEWLLS